MRMDLLEELMNCSWRGPAPKLFPPLRLFAPWLMLHSERLAAEARVAA
jgi:hypothetical protein